MHVYFVVFSIVNVAHNEFECMTHLIQLYSTRAIMVNKLNSIMCWYNVKRRPPANTHLSPSELFLTRERSEKFPHQSINTYTYTRSSNKVPNWEWE